MLDGDGSASAVHAVGGELHDVAGTAIESRPRRHVSGHGTRSTRRDEEIGGWRTRLIELRLRQPFKQAFREVYRLTPAEEETDPYSNRFAAHVLRYPQARALMTARRWGSNFLGPYDGGYNGIAKREFRDPGLRAEFWHDAVEQGDPMDRGPRCTTDQVALRRQRAATASCSTSRDVPPIVFSEAMRDVDLFVSVSSVGADAELAGRRRGGPRAFDDLLAAYGLRRR